VFISTAIDRYDFGSKIIEQNPKFGACIPDGATHGQVLGVLLKYLHGNFAFLVLVIEPSAKIIAVVPSQPDFYQSAGKLKLTTA